MFVISGVINFLQERHRYRGERDWAWAAYNRILLRVPRFLPWRRAQRRIWIVNRAEPFWVRLGTTDLHVLEEIYFKDEYAPVLAQVNRPVHLIVDLGANVGFSLRFWCEHFSEAKIIAVEPDADNARMCRANVESAGDTQRVDIVESCVGAKERNVCLESSLGEWAFRMVDANGGRQPSIQVRTLPQILAACGAASQIDLLKCDIEGAEAELFGDCESWISCVQNIVVELHSPYSERALLDDLKKAGADFAVLNRSKSESCPVLLLSRKAKNASLVHA